MQVPDEDEQEFIACARALGYEYRDEWSNEAFKLIMRQLIQFMEATLSEGKFCSELSTFTESIVEGRIAGGLCC